MDGSQSASRLGWLEGPSPCVVGQLRLGLPLHPLDHRINSFPVASQYMGDITGFIFYLTGASKYATFMIYGWFCFIGQLMACQALKIAMPEARYRRYVLLVLFLPSLLFWPSSAGKSPSSVSCSNSGLASSICWTSCCSSSVDNCNSRMDCCSWGVSDRC